MNTDTTPLRVAIVAGELSGDLLAGQLIAELRALWPHATFEGVAGPSMVHQGCQSLFSIDRLSVMGLVEVVRHLPSLLQVRRTLYRRWVQSSPDVFIGVDAPDFNIPLAARLRAHGIPTVHFVSPSIWAWRRYRVRKIARAIDLMLVLLPFEASFYHERGIKARFVGHPFADVISPSDDPRAARERLGLLPDQRVIGLLPGSRISEVARLTKPFLEIADWCAARQNDLVFAVPCATPVVRREIERNVARFAHLKVQLFDGRAREIMAAAQALVVASGTATLEALLVTTPMLVAYRLHPLSHALVRRLLHVRYFSLPNLLANDRLVEEFAQDQVCASVMGPRLLALLEETPQRDALRRRFREIAQSLSHNAAQAAAAAIVEHIASKHGV